MKKKNNEKIIQIPSVVTKRKNKCNGILPTRILKIKQNK
jgi:hypothetical protein